MAQDVLVLAVPTVIGPSLPAWCARAGPLRPCGCDRLPPPGSVPGLTVGEACAPARFGDLAGALLMSFGLFAPFVHLVPYARDVGLGEGFGVMLIVLLGVGSTVGPSCSQASPPRRPPAPSP